jgi:hypothetical protein
MIDTMRLGETLNLFRYFAAASLAASDWKSAFSVALNASTFTLGCLPGMS